MICSPSPIFLLFTLICFLCLILPVHSKRFRHVLFFGSIQKPNKVFQRCLFMMMTTAAGIRLFVYPAGLYAQLRRDKSKCMTVLMTKGLRHMAGNTAAEGMYPVGGTPLQCFVAIHA